MIKSLSKYQISHGFDRRFEPQQPDNHAIPHGGMQKGMFLSTSQTGLPSLGMGCTYIQEGDLLRLTLLSTIASNSACPMNRKQTPEDVTKVWANATAQDKKWQ